LVFKCVRLSFRLACADGNLQSSGFWSILTPWSYFYHVKMLSMSASHFQTKTIKIFIRPQTIVLWQRFSSKKLLWLHLKVVLWSQNLKIFTSCVLKGCS
jgi:hypothetical protein